MVKSKATLTPEGRASITMDLLTGTMGEKDIYICSLRSQGYFTFDPVFTSTASCKSKKSPT